MSDRINYEMTANDLVELLAAIKPTPAIMLQCGPLSSVQDRANAAWAKLGKKMGFDHMTVQPNGRGDRFFSAEPTKPRLFRDGDAWCATGAGFIDLQQSPAGFGATPEDALTNLSKDQP